MNNPEIALKNAVFEYLLATNNVKSAEVFFKESNLQSQYDAPVDEMVHNTHLYGSSCLICKLFNNWYTFAQNQRLITPQPSVLLHSNQKDENLEHMQQFLQYYHTHDDKHSDPNSNNLASGNTSHTFPTSPNTFSNTSTPNPTTPPPHFSHTHSPNGHFSTQTSTPPTTFNNSPSFASPNSNNNRIPTSPHVVRSPVSPSSNSDSIVSSPIDNTEMHDKSSEIIAKENEYLFSVERRIFNMENQPTDTTIANSDTLLQLLNINSLSNNVHPSTIYAPPAARPHTSTPSQIPPATTSMSATLASSPTLTDDSFAKEDLPVDLSDIDANIDKYNKAGRFCCPYPNCTKSFSTSAILKRHIKEHSGDRPYKCSFEGCGKGFARNYDLKVHMRSHTGEKPYRCTFMGCERTFTRSSDLRLHERIHKGEKPFVCDCAGCQKRFVRYADLKKHKRTHEVHEGHHPHVHGAGCGHTAIAHEDHIDYLHDAHLHNHHKDHIDDHKIGLTESNPNACTHAHSAAASFSCDPTHTHHANCGHELVPHYDHYDYLVDGHLHFVHDEHCDDHGWIDVVTWNPSDFALDGSGGSGGHEDDSG